MAVSGANIAIALQLLIQLTQQAQELSLLISRAKAEGRDVTNDELNVLRKQDDVARTQLANLIESQYHARDMSQFAQPPLEELVVNPNSGETAQESLVESVVAGSATEEDLEKTKEISNRTKAQKEASSTVNPLLKPGVVPATPQSN